jgi:hypothetical protein
MLNVLFFYLNKWSRVFIIPIRSLRFHSIDISVRVFFLSNCQFECSAGTYRELLELTNTSRDSPFGRTRLTFQFECFLIVLSVRVFRRNVSRTIRTHIASSFHILFFKRLILKSISCINQGI